MWEEAAAEQCTLLPKRATSVAGVGDIYTGGGGGGGGRGSMSMFSNFPSSISHYVTVGPK